MHRDQIYGCTAHHTCLVPGNSRNSQILMFCILHHNLHSEFGAISPPAPSGLVQLFRHQKTLTEHHEGPGQLSSHVIRKCAADVGDIDHFGSRIIAVWLRHRSSRWRYTNASCGLDLQVISTSRNGIHTIHVHGQLFIFLSKRTVATFVMAWKRAYRETDSQAQELFFCWFLPGQ